MAKTKRDQGFKFEKAMKDIERIVSKLEEGNMSLEESLAAFEEGVKLVRACRDYLEKTRQRIEMLVGDEGGEPVYSEFEDSGESDEESQAAGRGGPEDD